MFGGDAAAEGTNEPLLSDEETSALLDAMRDEETRGDSKARPTDLGSPEGPMREALAKADDAAIQLAATAKTQLLLQTARGVDVEILPAEVVPRDVHLSSIDARGVVYGLRFRDTPQGLLVIDSKLAKYILERSMGAPEEEESAPASAFSDLDRRILGPFPQAFVAKLGETFLEGRELELGPREESDDAGVRFEPMLRLGLRFSSGGVRQGELLVALNAHAVGASSHEARVAREAEAKLDAKNARDRLREQLAGVEIDLKAVLGHAPSSVRTLLSLHAGDVFRLDGSPGDPIALCVDDVVIARGNPVVHKGDLAVEVTRRDERASTSTRKGNR